MRDKTDFNVDIPVPETVVAGVNKKDQDHGPYDVNSVGTQNLEQALKDRERRRGDK